MIRLLVLKEDVMRLDNHVIGIHSTYELWWYSINNPHFSGRHLIASAASTAYTCTHLYCFQSIVPYGNFHIYPAESCYD